MEGGPPVFSAGSTCPQILSLRIGRFRFRLRDSHTLRSGFPSRSPTGSAPCLRSTPSVFLPKVWPLPISLATTLGISFDFFSSAYLDVSVRRVPFSYPMNSDTDSRFFTVRVSPFGYPRVMRLFPANRGFSQVIASFFGSRCQGIHLMLFFA